MSLHHAALAGVEAGQHAVAGDLVGLVGAPVVEVVAHGGYHEGEGLQLCEEAPGQQAGVAQHEVGEVRHTEPVAPVVIRRGPQQLLSVIKTKFLSFNTCSLA